MLKKSVPADVRPLKPQMHWIVDAVLFTGFVMSFFLNLTGLALHQWLGIGIGGLALYHLLVHWKWAETVTQRFLKCNWRMRVFYLLDVGLGVGLGGIVVTGIVISSWLDLPLTDYQVWRDLHVLSSLLTLLGLVVKLSLHWQWIVKFSPRLLPACTPVAVPAGGNRRINRREFLIMMGVIGGAAAAVVYNIGRRNFWNGAADPINAMAAPTSIGSPTPVVAATPGVSPTSMPSPAAPEERELIITTPTPSATPVPAATPTPVLCTVRCRNACAYPGRCRRYTDNNANGLCDFGECL